MRWARPWTRRGGGQNQIVEGQGREQARLLGLQHPAAFLPVKRVDSVADRCRHPAVDAGQIHRAEMSGMGDGELDEGDARQLEPPALVFAGLGDRGLQRREEKLRALGRDGAQQRVLVGEMVIRGGFGDARAAREIAQRQALGADLWKGLQRRTQQRPAKISVVVRAFAAMTGRRR